MNQITQRTSPAPEYAAGWLVGQLPVGMRDDDLLVRFTTIFEWLGATLRAGADGVEHAVDTTVTTPGMLRYLGTWLGYDLLDPGMPIERQRAVIAAIGEALPRRGTAFALRTLLEALTDAPVQIEEPGAVVREGQTPSIRGEVVVRIANVGHLRPHELHGLVRDEVPAHLGVRLVVGDGPQPPAADGPQPPAADGPQPPAADGPQPPAADADGLDGTLASGEAGPATGGDDDVRSEDGPNGTPTPQEPR